MPQRGMRRRVLLQAALSAELEFVVERSVSALLLMHRVSHPALPLICTPWLPQVAHYGNGEGLCGGLVAAICCDHVRFRQLAQHVFDTMPFYEQLSEGVGAMLRSVRVMLTDHMAANGANDPVCFEIRNLQVGARCGGKV